MQGYNFTNRVREVLAGARDEAARLRHEDVRSQHLLLALLRDDASVACHVIESFGVSLDDVERRLEETAKVGSEPHENRPQDLAYSSRAKKVLELSMAEARHLEHSYVGTQHLLLGLIREDHGVAFQTLASFGITLDPARKRVLEILGTGRQDDEGFVRRRSIEHAQERFRMRISTSGGMEMPLHFATPAPAPMAASIVEALAQDPNVAAVFAAQNIDVAKLAAALRARPTA
jgi:ATP-dependent Clp protease ATP-binding subunit ClpA